MKLLQLKLENFRQYKNSTIEFREGMTAIVGQNGTGKTTLLEAVTFALYGKQRENLDSVRFYWAESGKRYSVTLQFELGGVIYEACRTHVDAYLHEVTGGKEVVRATGKTAVNHTSERLLGLTYEQFKNSFCAEQKELGFLQFDSSTARQDEVARMLGFDRLKDAEELARSRRKDLSIRISGMRSSLEPPEVLQHELDQARTDLKEANGRIQGLQNQRAEAARQMPEANIAREKAEAFLRLSAEMSEIAARADELKKSAANATDAFTVAQKDAQERETLQSAEAQFQQTDKQYQQSQKLREANREREKFELQRSGHLKDVQRLESQAKAIKAPDLAKVQSALADASAGEKSAADALRAAEQGWKDAQIQANSHLSASKALCLQLAKTLEKAKGMLAKGVCPECGQPVSVAMKQGVSERESELRKAESEESKAEAQVKVLAATPGEVVKAREQLDSSRKDLEVAQAKRQESLNLQAELDRIQNELELKRKQVKEVEDGLKLLPSTFDPERHEALAGKLDELKPSHDRFLALADADIRLQTARAQMENALRELDQQKTRYADLKAQRTSTGFATDKEAHESVDAFNELATRLQVMIANIQGAEQGKARAERDLERAMERAKLRLQKEEELKALDRQESMHELTAREMKSLREHLNASIRPDLTARASENLSLLTNGRYPVMELDKNFKPRLMDDEIEKAVISGGEEDVVALSLRLALSELIQEMSGHPMSLLVLDEVFGSLDAERRQSVLERLLALKSRFRQIFIISHIEEINQVADQCIYLTRDPATRSTIVADALPEQIPLEI